MTDYGDLTGLRVDVHATTAADWGWVNEVVPAAEPDAIARMERFMALGGQTRDVELDLERLFPDLG